MKTIAETQIEENVLKPVQLETLPRFLNPPLIPNYILYNLAGLDVDTCEQWYLYDIPDKDPQTTDFVGFLTGEYFNEQNLTTRAGLLGKIPNHYCSSNAKRNPYFALPQSSINKDIYADLEVINNNPMNHHRSNYLDLLPDGALTFYKANATHLSYKAQINDHKFKSYHRKNGITKLGVRSEGGAGDVLTITDGLLTLMDMVHQALFRTLFNNTEIVALVQYMPIRIQELDELNRVLNILGASLYPIALSLLLPVFMYAIVLEKEEKLQDFMKMNGMSMGSYWLVNFCFDIAVFVTAVGIFYVFGIYIIQLQFFTQTNGWLLLFFMLGWGIAQTGLAFLIQVFISRARTATIWGYLLSIWTVLWGITLNLAVYPMPDPMPWYLLLYPHFALTRGIYILSYNCGYWKCIEAFSEASDELNWCIASLWIVGTAVLFLAMYLHEVIPREFGVAKHPLFCLKRNRQDYSFSEASIMGSHSHEFHEEDEAVKQERAKVYSLVPPYTVPLIVKDLTKRYRGAAKIAVNKLCLAVEEDEMFGLLGPNGAGKTTLISMLTGLHRPDSGDAWIAGHDITSNLDKVQLHMGVCPQFDILWPELSVEQHLLFYARLKGIPPSEEASTVYQAMENVFLTQFRTMKSCELSGGMRRRLSVAISLVGNPRIIFLDEPTTGLDPENRRQLWDILARCKAGRAMILTTHSMEEADVLCTRIAIVNQGILRCIGPQATLKTTYGGGYHLFVNVKKTLETFEESQDSMIENVRAYVSKVLPTANLVSDFNGNLVYQVPIDSCQVSYVFKEFEQHKAEAGIADWGISQSSLEDVFIKIVGDEED